MKIVVLAGGLSTERDVSITTGTQVCRALREKGHQAVLLDVFFGYGTEGDSLDDIFEKDANLNELTDNIQTIDPDLEKIKAMRKGNPDCLFGPNVVEICRMADIVYMGLHGADGENGKVQAAFDVLGVKYTGSGYFGSALAMDKGMAKKVFQSAGIPTPKGFTVTPDTVRPVTEEIGFPCVVKPCCGGSSVGVSIPGNVQEYEKALEQAFRYENEVLVEEFIKGREFSVGVIAGKALPVIEIIPKTGFYDYETKYQAGMAEDVCPAELNEELTAIMQKWAVDVYRELKLEVYGRIDFLLDADNQMYCLEANTLPGMTPTSLLPQEAKVAGVEYGELCETIVAEALKRYEVSGLAANKKKLKSEDPRNPGKKGKSEVEKESLLFGKQDRRTLPQPMMGMTLEAVTKAVGGVYTGPEEGRQITLSAITIDSRKVEKECLFVAIKGQRVDGNDFVPGAYEQGAACCMSTLPPKDNTLPYIQVESCEQALKDMAEYYRSILDVTVVGITGSVGKTTTKEMIASVISQKYDTLKTLGNFNNEIGLPLTIFRLRPHHRVAILEMGISDFGEMTRLAKVARPDACVITNIGQCHLENLGDRDGVLKAKTEVFDYLNPQGTAYLNGDDDKLITLASDNRIQSPVYFGLNQENPSKQPSVYAANRRSLGLAGSNVDIVTPQGSIQVNVPAPGKHMISNALAAAAVGLGLGLSLEQIKAGIEDYEPVGGHGHIIQTGSLTIMDDCYNANPVSMKAGIDVLSEVEGRTVAVLGDMFELGENERQMHYEVGRYAAEKNIDVLLAVGELGKEYARGAEEYVSSGVPEVQERKPVRGEDKKIEIIYSESLSNALDCTGAIIQPGDAVLVKASHAMHFEKIVEKLQRDF